MAWLVEGKTLPQGDDALGAELCHGLAQLWEKAQSLPLPQMSKEAPENSPIFFLHGVGFGLVRIPIPVDTERGRASRLAAMSISCAPLPASQRYWFG